MRNPGLHLSLRYTRFLLYILVEYNNNNEAYQFMWFTYTIHRIPTLFKTELYLVAGLCLHRQALQLVAQLGRHSGLVELCQQDHDMVRREPGRVRQIRWPRELE